MRSCAEEIPEADGKEHPSFRSVLQLRLHPPPSTLLLRDTQVLAPAGEVPGGLREGMVMGREGQPRSFPKPPAQPSLTLSSKPTLQRYQKLPLACLAKKP